MATWLTVNIILSALFFGAMVGIPLWMVIKRPDTGREVAQAAPRRSHPAARRQPGGSRPLAGSRLRPGGTRPPAPWPARGRGGGRAPGSWPA